MTLDDVPTSWRAAIAPLVAAPQTHKLANFLKAEEAAGKQIYPPQGQRLAALALTPLDTVRAVILGQDPYHGAGQAHGLCFSVQRGVKVPPSLVNIFKELQADIGIARPGHGNLEGWARQGVLMLNDVLTVEQGLAHAHKGRGWEAITDAIIKAVVDQPEPCVFLLWGKPAQRKAIRVPGLASGRHLVLTCPHPSGLSAYKGFFGCRHFSQTNTFLEGHGRGAIDWRLD